MEQKLVQSQTQQLILSPQLKQYLKLLQLPILDLKQSVEQELAQNPTLEEVNSNSTSPDSESKSEAQDTPEESGKVSDGKELRFEETIDQLANLDEEMRETLYREFDRSQDSVGDIQRKRNFQEASLSKGPTLFDYLEWQLGLLNLNQKQPEIALEISGNVNEDGYFSSTIDEVSQRTQSTPSEAEAVLKAVQTLDPPGVGGRNLQEVLLIQIKRKELGGLAERIVQSCLPLLEKKQYSVVAKTLGVDQQDVMDAFRIISRLEPKPGRIFYQNEPISVVPDIAITKDDSTDHGYLIEINDEIIPELRINPSYRQLIKQKSLDRTTKLFLREKIQSAIIYIRALGERKSTLRRIAEEIAKIQREFLDNGFSQLKPLRLKDLAQKIGVHESTISRAIHEKYVTSPQGTIPLKSFFSTGLQTENGGVESQKSVMEKIRGMISGEDKRKPLSDLKIAALLKREGIVVARRTVAKYRETLKISPSHLRKQK